MAIADEGLVVGEWAAETREGWLDIYMQFFLLPSLPVWSLLVALLIFHWIWSYCWSNARSVNNKTTFMHDLILDECVDLGCITETRLGEKAKVSLLSMCPLNWWLAAVWWNQHGECLSLNHFGCGALDLKWLLHSSSMVINWTSDDF